MDNEEDRKRWKVRERERESERMVGIARSNLVSFAFSLIGASIIPIIVSTREIS